MKQVEKRGHRIASLAELRAFERLLEVMTEDYPRARIEVDQSRVRVSGVGVVKRWLADASLRFVGGKMK